MAAIMPSTALEARNRLVGLLAALRRLGTTLGSIFEANLARAVGLYRTELRRAASVMALALATTLLGFAALVFVALAIMIAFWATHPVMASASIAVLFAVTAVVAALLVRGRTGAMQKSQHD